MAAPSDQNRNAPDNDNKVKKVGNYLLTKTLGQGSFGKVKLATHTLTNELVAIKILEKDQIKDVADMERITREINVLKLLYHPNVIKLYEVIDTQRHIYIVTEYADGGELFDYIVHHGRLKEREACKFYHMLINGVDYCHQHFIIHRDLKPENLLLSSTRQLKIIDFGLSNKIKPGGLLKTACGSPCYAAPEMIEGKMYVGQMSDLWSCGVILFALVCGYLPFEDQNTQALYQKILNARYRCPSTLSNECKHLISKILNTDPTKRYTSANIRQHPWFINNFVGQTIEEVFFKEGDITVTGGSGAAAIDSIIDENVVRDLEKVGYPMDQSVAAIRAKKHNQIVATYRLLLEKRIREATEAGKQYVIIPLSDSAIAPSATTTTGAASTTPASGSSTDASATAAAGSAKQPVSPRTAAVQALTSPGTASSNAAPGAGGITVNVKEPVIATNAVVEAKKEDAVMTAAAKAATQKRRLSLAPGQGIDPRMLVTAPAEEENKNEKFHIPAFKPKAVEAGGAVIIPSNAPSIAVHERVKADNKESDFDSLPEDDDDDAGAGQEMPQNMRAAMMAKAAAQKPKRRTSVAATKDAQNAYDQQQEDKKTAAAAAAATSSSSSSTGAGGEEGGKDVRVFRGLFNVSATSSKPPDVVLKEVEELLVKKRIQYRRASEESYLLKCEYPEKAIRFECEICKLPRLDDVCFVNVKRISGETFVWKDFCSQFFASMKL